MKTEEWEDVIVSDWSFSTPPSVRRLRVPGGWLYQVANQETMTKRLWHSPVFVPSTEAVQLTMAVTQRGEHSL